MTGNVRGKVKPGRKGKAPAPGSKTGKTATPKAAPHNEDHLDGCDVPIANATADADLPPARGGVELR